MALLDSGTFLRLIALDSQFQKCALEVKIKDYVLPTGLPAAIAALGAAQYGAGKPCISPYIGFEVVIGQDETQNLGGGDASNVWRMSAMSTGTGERLTFSIPGRDTEDPSLTESSSQTVVNMSNSAWTTWLAAIQAADLLAPIDSTGAAMTVQGGIVSTRPRVRPREEVRTTAPPHVIGGTRLKLWCIDTYKVKDYSQTFIAPITVASGMQTQILAAGNATYGSIPVTGPITPSLAKFAGWELIVRLDAGYPDDTAGAGDVRDKWDMKAVGAVNLDLRWSLPGRNTLISSLIVPGTRRLADMSNAAWSAWITAMIATGIQAPQDSAGSAAIKGGISGVRTRAKPRIGVPSGGT